MNANISSRLSVDGWEQCSIESLLEVSIGGIWGEENGLSEFDVDVVRVTELKAHGVIEPSTAAKRSITKKQYQSRALEVGDLLLEKSGGGPNTPVGRVGYVLSIDKPTVCSNFMQLMRPNADKVLPIYLHLFLTFLHSNGETIPLQTSTTNIRNIKTPEYMAVKVPVPSLIEQEKIVAVVEEQLSRLDAALASVRAVRVKAAQFNHSLLHAAFTGALTGHDLSSGQIPDEWQQLTLGDLVSVSNTSGLPAENPTLPFIGMEHIESETGKLLSYGDPADYRSSSYIVNSSQVLYGRLRPYLNKVFIPKEDSYASREFIPMNLNEELNQHFLLYRLRSSGFVEFAVSLNTGDRPRVKWPQMAEYSIALPPIDEQEQIIEVLQEQFSHLDACLAIADAIEKKSSALRRSLLHAAFSGDLTKEWREGAHV